MADQILFYNEVFHPEEADLPCLITYAEKSGGSHFSVTFVADLFLRGSKILFLTAYPMAKDNFLKQTEGMESKIAYVCSIAELGHSKDKQAIILESGNEALFMEAIQRLEDINDRVFLIKNMEVFSAATIVAALRFPKLVLSGDIDKSAAAKQIAEIKYRTIVAFTKPQTSLANLSEMPTLEKYTGYAVSENKRGRVRIEKSR